MTLLACCFALTPLVGLPAAQHGTLALSDTSQATARPAIDGSSRTEIDLSTNPSADVIFPLGRKTSFSIGYGPLLTLRDVFQDRDPFVLHTARAAFTHGWSRYRLTLAQTGSIGTQYYTTLTALTPGPGPTTAAPGIGPAPGAPTPTPQPAPAPAPSTSPQGVQLLPNRQRVNYLGEQSSVTLDVAWTRRTNGTFFVSYGIFGGSDEASQVAVPQQRALTFGASVGYALSRRDSLVTGAFATFTETSNGFQHRVVTESETWTRLLTRQLAASLSLGVAEDWTRRPDGSHIFHVYPTASATLAGALYSYRRRHFSLTVSFGLTAAPVVNTFTGDVQEVVGATTGATVQMDRTTVTAAVTAAQTIPTDDANAARVVGVGVTAKHQLSKWVDLFAGYATAVQVVGSSAQDQLATGRRQWLAFVGIALHAPPIEF